jgi:hypothetical protein
MSGGGLDATGSLSFGFVKALARDYFFSYVYSSALWGGVVDCDSAARFLTPFDLCPLTFPPVQPSFCTGIEACEPFSPGLHNPASAYTFETETDPIFGIPVPVYTERSGFLSTR